MKHKFAIGTLLCGVLIMPISVPSAQAADPAEVTFTTDGNWTVPTGVEIVEVNISGGVGGSGGRNSSGNPQPGGAGMSITAGLNVGAGDVLSFGLGENGEDSDSTESNAKSAFLIGYGGAAENTLGSLPGGGGGASAIAIGDSIVVIAGGGGGAGGYREGALTGTDTSGVGGAAGAWGTSGSSGSGSSGGDSSATILPTTDAGGPGGLGGGESPNTTPISNLLLTGSRNGGAGGDSDSSSGFNARGGGGGAGYVGGRGGGGGSAGISDWVGSGGGGGSSYILLSLIPGTNYTSEILTSGTPSGRLKYIDISTTSLPSATVDNPFTTTLAATFGAAGSVNNWAVSPALPTGITLNATTGVLSGTATAASTGTYTFTATKNTSGGSTSGEISARSNVSLSLTVAAAPTPTPTPDPTPNTGSGSDSGASAGPAVVAPNLAAVGVGEFNLELGINAALRVVTNAGSFSQFTIDPSLPAGLTLEPTTGIISGTPTELHRESVFEVTASNSLGQSKQSIRLSVSEKASTIPVAQERESVRFKAGSAKLRPNLKRQLNEFIDQKNVGTKIQGQVRLTGVIPKSGNGSVLARKRAVQVRKYLRANNVNVSSMIRIEIASDRPMTRRVVLND